MEKLGSKRSIHSFIAGLLAFAMVMTSVLSGFPAMQAKAAEAKVWYHVETGSGNGNSHSYSDASTNPAAVLLHSTGKMPASGGTFSVTYEKQGEASTARLGFFYTYLNDDNFLYVGYDSSSKWFYEYKVNGEGSYASMAGLPDQADASRTTFSVALSRETLTVSVNDARANITNQAFITLAENAAGNGRFGFRAGAPTSFHFTDARLDSRALDHNWSFLADCAGQVFEEEEPVPVYTVTGKVQDATSNAPIQDATVRIGIESAKTGSNGTFSLEVESGTYDVSVSAKSYTLYTASNVLVNANKELEPIKLVKQSEVVFDTYIEKDDIRAAISSTFPQVMQYKININGTEKTVLGQTTKLSTVKINNVNITPVMGDIKINADHAIYPMSLKDEGSSIDMEMTVKISVAKNDLTWEVTEIKKDAGCEKISTIEIPELNLVTITEGQANAQFKGATLSGNVNASGDEEITFSKGFVANNRKGYAYGFLSADGVSAGVWSNSEALNDCRLVRNNGADTMSLTSAAWYHDYSTDNTSNGDMRPSKNYDNTPVSELPCAKVCFAGDENEDGFVDWQDGAIAYRDIMNNPYDYESVKDLVNYRISMNFSSQATNPFLKTADNIKKVYLATDGLPQAVMMKGFGSEGHDSANSEYGNIGERIGGLDELKKLNAIAHQYNTQTGIHINAQESYPEAQSFNDALINGPGANGWGWLDQSYTINRPYDLGTGLRYKRLLQLYDQLTGSALYANSWPGVVGEGEDETVADAATIAATVAKNKETVDTNLDFIYLDVWYGESWETRKIAQQINSLGWRFTTEFGTEGEYDSTWQHWATEGRYGGSNSKGANSDVIRFIRNHQKDSFVLNYPTYGGAADNPLLGGFELGGFEGWGNTNHWFDQYMTITCVNNIPTKFLQHYQVYKWENYPDGQSPTGNHEKEITLKNEKGDVVVVTRNEEQRNDEYIERTIYLNDLKVLDDVAYLLPWTDPETKEEKLYHYNYDGGTTTWDLQDNWYGLSDVTVYKLTDTGRTEEQTVDASNGSVTLTAEPDTLYVVLKGKEAPKTVAEWSNHAHVKDTGFNSYPGLDGGDPLDESVWSGDTTAVSVVRMESSGNKYLQMGSSSSAQSVSTTISDLTPGRNYVAQVYVDNKSDAKAWLKVTGGKADVSNYTLRSLGENWVRCDAHNVDAVNKSRMQNMLVSFTANARTATLTLEREAGAGYTYFDDIRIIEKTLENDWGSARLEQDFETVTAGFYPFVMGPAQRVDDQVTHLSERHDPYTQSGWGNIVLDDVIGGNWSLKHHESDDVTVVGIIYRTIPQNIRFEPGVEYRVSFDYQSGCENSYAIAVGDERETVDKDGNTVLIYDTLDYLEKTAASSAGSKSRTEHFSFNITGAESGQSWFGLYCNGATGRGQYGQRDFVLDNLVVERLDIRMNETVSEVTSAKDPVRLSVECDNPSALGEVTWRSANTDVARVIADPANDQMCNVYIVGAGEAMIYAETTLDGSPVSVGGKVSSSGLNEESEIEDIESNMDLFASEYKAELLESVAQTKDYMNSLNKSDYTEESWKQFEKIYDDARKLASASGEKRGAEYAAMIKSLLEAAEKLEKKGTDVVPPSTSDDAKKALKAALDAAKKLIDAGQGNYTDESWNAFKAAYDAAYANANISDEARLNSLRTALIAAQNGLAQKPPVVPEPVPSVKKGQVYTDTKKKLQYKVTDAAKKTVTVVKGTKKNATSVTIPATVTIDGVNCKVTEISAKAFKGFRKLRSVTIGSNVTKIGNSSFEGCAAMTKATIGSNVKTIGKKAFYNCKKLAKVTIKGKKITKIQANAFKGTSSKLKVTLPKKLTKKQKNKLNTLLKKAGA